MSAGILKRKLRDPLLHDAALPFSATFYPLGFRLEIATDSRDVIQAAAEAWSEYPKVYSCEPMRLSVLVSADGDLAPEPVFRARGHHFTIVSDRANHAMYDSRSMTAVCYVSAATAADHAWFRWFFLEAIVYMLLTQRYVVPVHAACVAREDRGLLLCGKSGAGKSTLAFACAQAGWDYVADDATFLLPGEADSRVLGKPHLVRLRDDAPRLFPQLDRYAASRRPNGKLSLEIPTSDFPTIRTVRDCALAAVVFLKRESGARRQMLRIESAEAIERLFAELPSYGDEVNAIHEGAVERLAGLPAYEMTYEELAPALALLEEIVR